MSNKTNSELENKCSDVFVKEALFQCRASWNCPNTRYYESKKLCGVKGNIDTDAKIEYIIDDANKDLAEKNYRAAGRKYKLASNLSKPLTAEQVGNLLAFAYRAIDNNRLDNLVPQVGLSGGDPENFLIDIKGIAKETVLQTKKDSEKEIWIKRYERIHEWLDEYYNGEPK